jgi:hypothetical protein
MVKIKVNMANKQCNNISMEMLQHNMESWSVYKNGIRTKEIVFIPVKGHDYLHKEIKSSEKPSIHKKGGEAVEINNLDLSLKL